MKDYKTIIAEVMEATKEIKDEKLKEIAFQRLLDDALNKSEGKEDDKKISKKRPLAKDGISLKSKGKKSSIATLFSEKSVRSEVKKAFEDTSTNQEGLKPFASLKRKWEKYLWVLEVGKQKNLTVMTNAEIAYVLNKKFAERVTEKQVNNLRSKISPGYVQSKTLKKTKAWKIEKPGSVLLKEKNRSL